MAADERLAPAKQAEVDAALARLTRGNEVVRVLGEGEPRRAAALRVLGAALGGVGRVEEASWNMKKPDAARLKGLRSHVNTKKSRHSASATSSAG